MSAVVVPLLTNGAAKSQPSSPLISSIAGRSVEGTTGVSEYSIFFCGGAGWVVACNEAASRGRMEYSRTATISNATQNTMVLRAEFICPLLYRKDSEGSRSAHPFSEGR